MRVTKYVTVYLLFSAVGGGAGPKRALFDGLQADSIQARLPNAKVAHKAVPVRDLNVLFAAGSVFPLQFSLTKPKSLPVDALGKGLVSRRDEMHIVAGRDGVQAG